MKLLRERFGKEKTLDMCDRQPVAMMLGYNNPQYEHAAQAASGPNCSVEYLLLLGGGDTSHAVMKANADGSNLLNQDDFRVRK